MKQHDSTNLPAGPPRRSWAALLVAAGVLLAWVAVVAIAAPLAGRLSSVQRNDAALFLPSNSESTQALRVESKFAGANVVPAVLVYERKTGITEADRIAVNSQLDQIKTLPGVAGELSPVVASPDGLALRAVVAIDSTSVTQSAKTVDSIRHIAQSVPGLTAHVTGPAGLSADFGNAFASLDIKLLVGTTIVVVLILLAVYRSPFLWILPLAGVGVAVVLAQALVYVAAAHFGLGSNGQSQGVLTVLLFGAGTDYALLLISRYREELRRYPDARRALTVALRGSAPAILASGSTVILALLCLTLSTNGANRSLGPTGAIGIASAMIAMLTFLPALLMLVGRRVFWPLTPRFEPARAQSRGVWDRIASVVGRRSRPALVVSSAVLALLAVGLTQLQANGLPALSQYTVAVDSTLGQQVVDAHFPTGEQSQAVIITTSASADSVARAVRGVPGVIAVSALPSEPGATTPRVVDGQVLLNVTISGLDGSPEAQQTVSQIRVAAHAVPGSSAIVGGTTAIGLDTRAASQHDFALIVPLVLAVILIVLVVLLRSLVAPLLLVASVVLSFAASLGLSALLFRHVFHFAGEDSSFPLTTFVFLVALGVDYNIFLMSRVREFAKTIGTRPGIIAGLASTGSVITSAGIVLAATFSVFAVLPLVVLAELGIAVAVGVLIDTVIVRTLLVPAATYSLGGVIWWPSRLAADRSREAMQNNRALREVSA